jgi:DNA (cytosine-5)-methyltransferase 1
VPGVLSSNQGRDFAAFLTSLGIIGYGWSYRVLDAQYFGVAQRRRRVFVVGHLGDWRPAAEVLFESDCLSRNPKQSREKEQDITYKSKVGTITKSWGKGLGHNGQDDMAVIHPISFPAAMQNLPIVWDTTNITSPQNGSNPKPNNPCHTLAKGQHPPLLTAICCIGSQHPNAAIGENISPTLTSAMGTGGGHIPIIGNMQVRRLTPIECERLQGFPDNYTNIPNAADTNRYKALGNSMAVPVMRWIGERINRYELRGMENGV